MAGRGPAAIGGAALGKAGEAWLGRARQATRQGAARPAWLVASWQGAARRGAVMDQMGERIRTRYSALLYKAQRRSHPYFDYVPFVEFYINGVRDRGETVTPGCYGSLNVPQGWRLSSNAAGRAKLWCEEFARRHQPGVPIFAYASLEGRAVRRNGQP